MDLDKLNFLSNWDDERFHEEGGGSGKRMR